MLELLSPKRVESFRSVREEEVSSLVEKLREATGNGGAPVNLCEMLISTSNNVILRCIFGRSFRGEGGGESGKRMGEMVRRVMVQIVEFSVGDLFPALRWIDVVRGFVGRLKSSVGDLNDFYDRVLQQRRTVSNSRGSDVKDFVDILLELQKDNDLHMELTIDHLRAILQVSSNFLYQNV